MLSLTYFGSFSITYPIQSACLNNFIPQMRLRLNL